MTEENTNKPVAGNNHKSPHAPKDGSQLARAQSLITADQDPGVDYIVRATALDHSVRAFACRTTMTCQEATRMHNLSPSSATALGRMMSGLLMMAHDLKGENESISAIIKSDGPIGGMTVVATGQGTVRGFVNQPVVDTVYQKPGKLDIGTSVGKGTLRVIRDSGMKEPYMGQVDLLSGEIAEDLAGYLYQSEQIPTVLSLGVLLDRDGIQHAGGLMVQLMPDAGDDIAAYLESRAAGFPELSFLLQEGFNPQQLIDLFIGDQHIVYHSLQTCRYACTCSRERMTRSLVALGRDELKDLATDPQGIELTCHFCNKKYHFPQAGLQDLIRSLQIS